MIRLAYVGLGVFAGLAAVTGWLLWKLDEELEYAFGSNP